MERSDALVIVDLQNDFCPGGALAVPAGDEIVQPINLIVQCFPLVVATSDWHPKNHCSFKENEGPWPPHCVQHTRGAELHPDLDLSGIHLRIFKADRQSQDAYSGFQGTSLKQELKSRKIKRVFVVGLATDYCVKQTALNAVRLGFETVVLTDLIRAVNVQEEDGDKALQELRKAGVRLAVSSKVIA